MPPAGTEARPHCFLSNAAFLLPDYLNKALKQKQTLVIALVGTLLVPAFAQNPPGHLLIEVNRPAGQVSPLHHGLMTEEINHSYDGGLYAELVQNRAFLDDPQAPAHWSVAQGNGASAVMALDPGQPLTPALPVSLRVAVATATRHAPAGVANEGYWGIPVKPQTRFRASF
jgi:alpha-N-arabinofuranosidase